MLANTRSLVRLLAAGFAFLALAVVAPAAHAADPVPLPTTPDWVSPGLADGACLVWGDLDGDGDLDMIPGAANGALLLYRNDGIDQGGGLRFSHVMLPAGAVSACALGDMDQDGRLDIVVGAADGGAWVFPNTSPNPDKMEFGVRAPVAVDAPNGLGKTISSIALADMDYDGWLDVAIGAGNTGNAGVQADYVYKNAGLRDGLLEFTRAWASAPRSGGTLSLAWGDADGNGKVDALAAGSASGVSLYRVDSSGAIVEPPARLWPNSALPSSSANRAVAEWGDMDGDGYPDLAVGAPVSRNLATRLRVYRNSGGVAIQQDKPWESFDRVSASGLSWGDVDNDGDLDLAVGQVAAATQLYLNIRGSLEARPSWSSAVATPGETLVAWADVDNDGDLDLSQVSRTSAGSSAFIYLNRGRPLPGSTQLRSPQKQQTSTAAAWADVDNDGRLELAIGRMASDAAPEYPWSPDSGPAPSALYKVEQNRLTTSDLWQPVSATTTSLAWGDMDGDGWSDLALGNIGQNQVYLNERGRLAATPLLSLGVISDTTVALAWSDISGDAAPDLIVALRDQPARLYLNKRETDPAQPLKDPPDWTSDESGPVSDLAVGDLNNDGALDFVLADFASEGGIRVYMNEGGQPQSKAAQIIPVTNAYSIALGDVNKDGYLDLAIGGDGGPKQVLLNDGGRLQNAPAWVSADADRKTVVELGDANGDGYLDLTAGSGASETAAGPVKVHVNHLGSLDRTASWTSDSVANVFALAWGDPDGNRLPDLAVATGRPPSGRSSADLVFLNRGAQSQFGSPRVSITMPDAPAPASRTPRGEGQVETKELPAEGIDATANISNTGVLTFTYTVENLPVRLVRGLYSTNGGATWSKAIRRGANTNEITEANGGVLIPGDYQYEWDVFRSGFRGQSENVMFRLDSYPSILPEKGGAANSYRSAMVTTQTPSFTVRGSQVRVVDEGGMPAAGALVFRLRADDATGGKPIGAEGGGPAVTTDLQGYLQGQGEVSAGERLVALQPISVTRSYTLYHTSLAFGMNGMTPYTATASGLDLLQTSNKNPLLLFNLNVSLEWDARDDGSFLADLERAIRRSSALLYQVTGGQVALGDVSIYQSGENWHRADIVIYADNSIRPSASIGGVVAQVTADELPLGKGRTASKSPRA